MVSKPSTSNRPIYPDNQYPAIVFCPNCFKNGREDVQKRTVLLKLMSGLKSEEIDTIRQILVCHEKITHMSLKEKKKYIIDRILKKTK